MSLVFTVWFPICCICSTQRIAIMTLHFVIPNTKTSSPVWWFVTGIEITSIIIPRQKSRWWNIRLFVFTPILDIMWNVCLPSSFHSVSYIGWNVSITFDTVSIHSSSPLVFILPISSAGNQMNIQINRNTLASIFTKNLWQCYCVYFRDVQNTYDWVIQVPLWPSGIGFRLWNRRPKIDPRTARYTGGSGNLCLFEWKLPV